VSGPSGSPNSAPGDSTVQVQVVAQDSYNHALTYAWTANCGGGPAGSFTNPAAATTTWNPPGGNGLGYTCTLSVVVTDTLNESATGSYQQVMDPLTHEIKITTPLNGTPDPVEPTGDVTMHLVAVDTYAHPLTYHWQATCPGLPSSGFFFPNDSFPTPFWTSPD